MNLTKKQTKAIDILEDDSTVELYYGGAAGGGKSALGCYWQLKRRLKYAGSRGCIGRSSLKTLKETTLQTFFEVAKMQGLKRNVHFKLTSAQDSEHPNCLVFYNGSLIYLKDLYAYPNDPEFDELGSLEIMDAFVDEAPQVTAKAKGVLRSRIRHRLDDFGLIPKMLFSGNPSKGWAYSEFYKPNKENRMEKAKAFIQALPNDNPHLPKSYIESLIGLEQNSKERLLFGNWEYSDDPTILMQYEKILELFTNSFITPTPEKYLIADIAYEGSDLFVIGYWEGLVLQHIEAIEKCDELHIGKTINDLRVRYSVPMGNVLYDADGLKKFVQQSAKTGLLQGAKQFHNNGTPLNKENYYNLKSQCYFKAAELVNTNKIFINFRDYRDQIIKECEQIKQLPLPDDGKLRVEKKADLKLRLGHSPDFFDMLAMRCFFEIKPVHQTTFISFK